MNDETFIDEPDVGSGARVAAMRRRQASDEPPETSWIDPNSVLGWLASVLPDWLTNRSVIGQNRQRLEDIEQMTRRE